MPGLIRRGKVWYAVIRENGKEWRVSLKTTSVARAREKLVELERAQEKGEEPARDATVSEFLPMLEAHLQATRSPHTTKTMLHEWKHFTEWAKPLRLSDCNQKLLLDYRNHLLSEGYAPSTIRTTLAELSAIFKVAIQELGIWTGTNPAHGIPLMKEVVEIPRFLTRQEVDEVMAAAEAWGRDLHLVFALGLFAGLRYNEITNAIQ